MRRGFCLYDVRFWLYAALEIAGTDLMQQQLLSEICWRLAWWFASIGDIKWESLFPFQRIEPAFAAFDFIFQQQCHNIADKIQIGSRFYWYVCIEKNPSIRTAFLVLETGDRVIIFITIYFKLDLSWFIVWVPNSKCIPLGVLLRLLIWCWRHSDLEQTAVRRANQVHYSQLLSLWPLGCSHNHSQVRCTGSVLSCITAVRPSSSNRLTLSYGRAWRAVF